MTTKERDRIVARVAIIGLAVCSGSRGTTLAAATPATLDALEALGASTDYRDADNGDLTAVCDGILDGTIRCTDAMWHCGDDGTVLPRLARLAKQTIQ